MMRRLVRLVHRVTGHRFVRCELVDLRGDRFIGRACACGYVDESAWQPVGSVVSRSRPA